MRRLAFKEPSAQHAHEAIGRHTEEAWNQNIPTLDIEPISYG